MTPEEANAWIERIIELEGNAFAGTEVSDEETLRLGHYYLSGEYLIRNLEIVRGRKQQTLYGLAHLEATEKDILDAMREQNICIKSNKTEK